MSKKMKLVRDNIPHIMKTHSQDPDFRVFDNKERTPALAAKLVEESREIYDVVKDGNFTKPELLAELADLQQVIDSLMKHSGISYDEVLNAMRTKVNTHGAFDRFYCLTYDSE